MEWRRLCPWTKNQVISWLILFFDWEWQGEVRDDVWMAIPPFVH